MRQVGGSIPPFSIFGVGDGIILYQPSHLLILLLKIVVDNIFQARRIFVMRKFLGVAHTVRPSHHFGSFSARVFLIRAEHFFNKISHNTVRQNHNNK